MATTPTSNQIPSESPQDLKFNAGKIDEFVTSLALQYIDRFGGTHYTIEGLKQLALQQIYNLGWNTVGTFQDGAMVTAPGDILQDESTGVWYRWDDPTTLPKTIPVDSTPESTGGIGDGKWLAVDVSDVFRKEIATSTGAGLVGYGAETVESALSTLPSGKNVYDLIIVYGQSNAVGWGQDTPGFPSAIHDKAQYFNPVTNVIGKIIKTMPSSSGQTSTGHGWASFANEYIRLTGRGVVVVNGAYGGVAIADLAKPATPGTTLYDKLTSAVNNAKSQMTASNLPLGNTYAIWNQGEQDAVVDTNASAYRTALVNMIENFTSDFGIKKFLIQLLGSCYNYTSEYKVVRIQQAQIDTAAIRTDTLLVSNLQSKFTQNNGMLQVDNVHYTQRGYNLSGQQSAQKLASLNFNELAESDLGTDTYGGLLTSGRRRTRLSHVRVKKTSSGWGVYSENDPSGSYTQQFVDGADLANNNTVRIPFVGTIAPYYSGEVITPNRAMQIYNLTVTGDPVTIDSTNGIYGRDYRFLANLSFTVNTSGGISVVGGDAQLLNLVNKCVVATTSGSTVILTLQAGATTQYPTATSFGAGSVSLSGTSGTTVTVSFTGGSPGAIIRWDAVPVNLDVVPNGSQFSATNFIGNQSD